MRLVVLIIAGLMALTMVSRHAAAQQSETRVAFVIGNSAYEAGALPTAANDAGLVAQTLQAAGFEVMGARDVDADTLRESYRDFLKRLSAAGPGTVAFVYIAGYGLQYGNENYVVPIGASITRDLDIPAEAIRLSDLIGPLSGLNLKARFTVFDLAYPNPFAKLGTSLAGGLALVDANPGSLIAYNAAPGTVAPIGSGDYGAYARSLAEMIREGELSPDEIFDRVRLRVNDATQGAEVPWESSKVDAAFRFFDRAKDAPTADPTTPAHFADPRAKPIGEMPVNDAYVATLDRDTIPAYEKFVAVYNGDPLATRARALLATRREAVTWHCAVSVDTPDAYWSYLSRYPRGPHVGDARLRLQALVAALDPPPRFNAIYCDVAPPSPEETVYIERPVLDFTDSTYRFPRPPRAPVYFLPPIPIAFVDLPPPPPSVGLFFLPFPVFIPLPTYINPPAFVVAPSNNVFYSHVAKVGATGPLVGANGIHRPLAGASPGPGAGQGLVTLPSAAERRGAVLLDLGIKTTADLVRARAEARASGSSHGPVGPKSPPIRQQLPGLNGKPLPPVTGSGQPVISRPTSNAQVPTLPVAGVKTPPGASQPTGRPSSNVIPMPGVGPKTQPVGQPIGPKLIESVAERDRLAREQIVRQREERKRVQDAQARKDAPAQKSAGRPHERQTPLVARRQPVLARPFPRQVAPHVARRMPPRQAVHSPSRFAPRSGPRGDRRHH